MTSRVLKVVVFTALAAFFALPATAQVDSIVDAEALVAFGKELYFDKSLSSPSNQSCAVCHEARSGFTGPIPGINKAGAVYPGAVHQRFGNRRPPTASYAGESPQFHFDPEEELFVGGMFWDGRATGWVTGDPLADQAMGPYLNPVEQNLPSEESACMIVAQSRYAHLYEVAFGAPFDCTTYDTDGHLVSYKNFARAVAAFERSPEVSPYDSKFDYVVAGLDEFTPQEAWGFEIFNGKGLCFLCHPSEALDEDTPAQFTDFTYDNLGVPKNPENPFYAMDQVYIDGEPINPQGAEWVDPGLAGFLNSLPNSWFIDQGWEEVEIPAVIAENYGKHKVPTLRNVDKRPGPGFAKSYMHNGALKSLEEVVQFYNKRDAMILAGTLEPEIWENMNEDELGDLGLTPREEAALVAFLRTLSDGHQPPKGNKKR
jgi:cytochrome c peroxidase